MYIVLVELLWTCIMNKSLPHCSCIVFYASHISALLPNWHRNTESVLPPWHGNTVPVLPPWHGNTMPVISTGQVQTETGQMHTVEFFRSLFDIKYAPC